jgi:flagellar motility protein MotE (MotC chaperone)
MKKQRLGTVKPLIYFFIVLNILIAGVLVTHRGDSLSGLGAVVATAEAADEPQANDETSDVKEIDGDADNNKATEDVKLMLDGLEEKRIQLQKQEERIQLEQKKLNGLKQELEDKMAELERTHELIEQSLARLDRKKSEKERLREEEEDRKIKQLVKVYSNMKPKQAGEIINKMDIVIAEKIFLSMKGEAAGQILSYVDSAKAAQISERLAVNIGSNEPDL